MKLFIRIKSVTFSFQLQLFILNKKKIDKKLTRTMAFFCWGIYLTKPFLSAPHVINSAFAFFLQKYLMYRLDEHRPNKRKTTANNCRFLIRIIGIEVELTQTSLRSASHWAALPYQSFWEQLNRVIKRNNIQCNKEKKTTVCCCYCCLQFAAFFSLSLSFRSFALTIIRLHVFLFAPFRFYERLS